MKDGPFAALQTDHLPLPELKTVLSQLIISKHARERFTERARAGQLNKKLLQSAVISRRSPSGRAAEDYRRSPDLYMIFDFQWLDGRPDQGCLLLHRSGPRYIARTFISESSNSVSATTRPRTPKLPGALAKKLATAGHCSEQENAALVQRLAISARRPDWIASDQAGDAWIDGGAWAISVHRQLVGAGNPYHYSWGRGYSKAEERKRRGRQRWAKKRS